jgi:hypothetical protein
MGLLEDAIREHLELKRLRGADPAEVAREQREALDPLPGAESAGWSDEQAVSGTAAGENAEVSRVSVEPAAGSSVGQETAELDMQTVLEGEGISAGDHAGGEDAEPAGTGADEELDEDPLEWETPAASGEPGASPLEPAKPEQPSGATDHEPSTEELRTKADEPAPGQGRLSI